MHGSGSRRNVFLAEGLVLAAFVSAMSLFLLPGLDCFQFDYDEGVNLAKSRLVAQGHRLYADIWSDQPPLFTHVQAVAFHLVGFGVSTGRAVVLAFSALLLWAMWTFMRHLAGRTHAVLALLVTIQVSHFARLSISSMVGLPMLSLAMCSLALLAAWHATRHTRWLWLSGALLGLSVSTKLQSAFLAPIVIVGLVVSEWTRPSPARWRSRLAPACAWATAFGTVVVVLVGWLVGFEHVGQLVVGHVQAREADVFSRFTFRAAVDRSQVVMMALPALVGMVLLVRGRRWLGLYLVGWLGTAVALLLGHAPVWYHHALLVMVPMGMLAAYAAGELIGWAAGSTASPGLPVRRGLALVTVVACLCLSAAEQARHAARALAAWPASCAAYEMPAPDHELLALMAEQAHRTRWCLTDLPMYALRTGVDVPPEVAALSAKRLATGEYTQQDMLDQLRGLRPGLVYLARFDWPVVRSFLETDPQYRAVHSTGAGTLYVRAD